MSILDTPRIVFTGRISWDPIVTNNRPIFYDEDTARTLFGAEQTVDEFRAHVSTEPVVKKLGNWNPHGTHRSVFYDCYVNTIDCGAGADSSDPFVGNAVDFEGMLVDCEPYGAVSSQLFFDDFSIGVKGGHRIYASRTSRATARFINFHRLPGSVYGFAASVASVSWQTSFDKAELNIDSFDSPVLQSLQKALQDDDALGLTLNFNTYATHYYGTDQFDKIDALEDAFVEQLKGGGFQPNPAVSRLVGTIGIWRRGEPPHEAGGRSMLAMPFEQDIPYVATAHAELGKDALSIDFSNSISETDVTGTKQNLETLVVHALNESSGAKQEIARIPYEQYDQKAYEKTAGIITLPLNSDQVTAIQQGQLLLESSAGKVYLQEQIIRGVPYDPNLYIEVGQKKTTDVLVLNKGRPAGSGIEVALVAPQASTIGSAPRQITNEEGIATFDVTGIDGRVEQIQIVANPGNKQIPEFDQQRTPYMYVRTLPTGDDVAALDPTWGNVYRYCLANWNAMAPCMDNWLNLKDPRQVKACGTLIKRLTNPDNFEAYRFMPVTRDMTAGERKLLYAFLDADEAVPSLKIDKPGVTSSKTIDVQSLSRKMRTK